MPKNQVASEHPAPLNEYSFLPPLPFTDENGSFNQDRDATSHSVKVLRLCLITFQKLVGDIYSLRMSNSPRNIFSMLDYSTH